MTQPLDKIIVRHTVLSFDICSSTKIMENLLITGNLNLWRDFLINIKEFLIDEDHALPFNLYNFTGDGWIMLFDYQINGTSLLSFLDSFCTHFSTTFDKKIKKVLETTPSLTGITFGMDRGELIKVRMNKRIEYIGRAINMACRLQSAIKDRDPHCEYKLLMTKDLYSSIRADVPVGKFLKALRSGRNIAGGKEIECMKTTLLETVANTQKTLLNKSI